jgi:hypothetical protein
MNAMSTKELTELIKAVADLLWPIFAFVVFGKFRKPLVRLLPRLKKGKFFGQEIELEESLAKAEVLASAAAQDIVPLPSPTSDTPPATDPADSVIAEVLRTVERNPKAALLQLTHALERELRTVLATSGLLSELRRQTLLDGFRLLDSRGSLPKHLLRSVELFLDIRNRIVHGHEATDDDVLRAVDIGVLIYRSLVAVPHETFVVTHPSVEIYSDDGGKEPIKGATALILEATTPGGTMKRILVVPTTKLDYNPGQRVSWEHNTERTFGPTWYRDPTSQQLKPAWHGSMEFTGRNLADL